MRKNIILIVDDEYVNQRILEEYLKDYELLHAYNGEEAMALVNEQGEQLSLILLDLHMPMQDGFEVLKQLKIREGIKEIPVVVMSGDSTKEGLALQLGALDFWRKPFADPNVIISRVRNLIEFYEQKTIINEETHDVVTGLLNMRNYLKLADAMKKELAIKGKLEDHALLFLDLSNFKEYNLKYGMERGDVLLKDVADLFVRIFVDGIVCRMSDDHFVTITGIKGLENKLEQAAGLVEQLGAGVNMHLKAGIKYGDLEDLDLPIAMSCELAKGACDLITGENESAFKVFDKKQLELQKRREYIIEHLDYAMEQDEIVVYLQPVVRSLTGALCGAEALVRWIDPKLGFLSPGEFIPILEDAKLIHKMDIYVFRKVCALYRERIDRHEPVVPVSFNLSRLDFLLCDIREEILRAVNEYEVPRNMLNVEITESMFVRDATRIRDEIDQFHHQGFNVWMDDFGSGYSSLNVLKDYEFDELKIDMAFLSSFTSKSRNIIRSIVRMAKELGIQTLAEGVETEEQFQFLRSIGCEKIQGYYFGKPEPAKTMYEHMLEQGKHYETNAWSDYYDQAGKLNLMDDRPLALLNDDGKNFHYLYANEAFMMSLQSIGITSIEQSETYINETGNPMHVMFRRFADDLIQTEEEKVLTYPVGTQYMSIQGKVIAKCNGMNLHVTRLNNVTHSVNEERQNQYDSLIRNVLYLYNVLSVIDIDRLTIKRYDTTTGSSALKEKSDELDLIAFTEQYMREVLHFDDRKAFKEFLDLETLAQRVRSTHDGQIYKYFRCLGPDGNYRWNEFTLLSIPYSKSQFIVVSREAAIEQEEERRRLFQIYLSTAAAFAPDDTMKPTPKLLWDDACKYASLKFFWKDRERRFVGVSRSFLDYYGLESEEEVIGKTDEEMGWHVSDGPYRSDEEDVLKYGKRIIDSRGKCIIKGVLHNIVASKMPVYKVGKIVGLMGYFVDAENIEDSKNAANMTTVDLVTGLSNLRGLMETFIQYIEAFRNDGKDFAAICIFADGYEAFRKEYTEEDGDALLQKLRGVLVRSFGTEASIGRLRSSEFVALIQSPEQVKIQQILQHIQEGVSSITSIHEHKCTCFIRSSVQYAASSSDFEEMMIGLLRENNK